MIMKCLTCKADEMKKSKDDFFTKIGDCYLIIKNAPCYKCDMCGEVFYTLSVTEKINDIVHNFTKAINKEVVICDYSREA